MRAWATVSSLYSATSFEAACLLCDSRIGHVAHRRGKSIKECVTRQVDEHAPLLYFEFIVWGDRMRVAGLAELDET